MIRLLLFVTFAISSTGFAQELPPYSPQIDDSLMTSYVNNDLSFSVRYPAEFKAGTAQDLKAILDRGHRDAYGTAPESDPEHQQAIKCMRVLLYAASQAPGSATAKTASDELTPDTILVINVDRTCLPKNVKGDKALSGIAASLLDLPGMKPLVQQMWFQGGGGHKIHSGMAGRPSSGSAANQDVPDFIAAAAFEQKEHWILVAYLNGTRDDGMHKMFPYTSVSFGDGRPVLLFPFLVGNVNLVK